MERRETAGAGEFGNAQREHPPCTETRFFSVTSPLLAWVESDRGANNNNSDDSSHNSSCGDEDSCGSGGSNSATIGGGDDGDDDDDGSAVCARVAGLSIHTKVKP